ncbi:MAG: HupE/UreJ family protein [Bryobacterales bacterium]|nr:HupE/UreJ family protein [Bryobacterales bacterium]
MRRGFWHTLGGPNHVLFLVRLVLPVRRLRPLVLIVSVFTAENSVTLVASAMRFAPSSRWFPPLGESLIATPTLFKAIESADGTGRRRSLMALGFGLVHGFGFPFALSESLRFAEAHVVTSLLAFTVGGWSSASSQCFPSSYRPWPERSESRVQRLGSSSSG